MKTEAVLVALALIKNSTKTRLKKRSSFNQATPLFLSMYIIIKYITKSPNLSNEF